MLIILHNCAHNGDIFFSQKIVEILIKSNPKNKFLILPACSKALFNNIKDYQNVEIKYYHNIWDINCKNKSRVNKNNLISININLRKLWYYKDKKIFINLHQLLTNTGNCIDVNIIEYINQTVNKINKEININLKFNCDNYINLIPSLKNIIHWNTNEISQIFKKYKSKVVFYYNIRTISFNNKLNNNNYRENIIKKLQQLDCLVVTVRKSKIEAPNILCCDTDLNIGMNLDGTNLIKYAKIANICDYVIFHSNGGSFFILNDENISNKDTKPIFISFNKLEEKYYNVMKNSYKYDNIEHYNHVSFYNNIEKIMNYYPNITKTNASNYILLLDLDGTIITESIHHKVYRDLFKEHNIDFTYEDFLKATNHMGITEYICKHYNIERKVVDKLVKNKRKQIIKSEYQIELIDGFIPFLETVINRGINIVIVTNSPKSYVDFVKRKLPILNNIKQWVTREDYKNPKPHKEPYMTAIEKFGKNEKYIIGFENSINGIKSLEQVTNYIYGCEKEYDLSSKDIFLYKDYSYVLKHMMC